MVGKLRGPDSDRPPRGAGRVPAKERLFYPRISYLTPARTEEEKAQRKIVAAREDLRRIWQIDNDVKRKVAGRYRYFVPIKVGGTACRAMVDSGNLWRNVMSTGFLKSMGLEVKDLRKVAGADRVGTAKEGSGLKILGELKEPISITFGDGTTRFKCRPVVLEGLSMPFNISGPFLHANKIDQIHSEGALKVQGRRIPLIASVGAVEEQEAVCSNLYVNQTTTIPAMSTGQLEVKVAEIIAGRMPGGDGMVRGGDRFMEKTNLHPYLYTVVTTSPEGKAKVGVLNTTTDPITVQAGTKYGSFRRTIDIENHSSKPWRIAILDNRQLKPVTKGFVERADPEEAANLPGWMKGQTTKENRKKRMEHMIHIFKLGKGGALKSTNQVMQAASLLVDHWQTFSFDGSYGRTDLLRHQISVCPEQRPINQRWRPINPSLEADLRKQVDQWLKHKVIEKSRSPWNFGLVAAPKKNGKIRWCVDYRELNKVTTKDSHPIGNIQDNLARLSRSTIFSGIDGSGAFHVVELEDRDKAKTAFATPWGSYQFVRMPFGLCGAPSTYARLVNMVLQGIPHDMALPYLDDTVVHSKTLEYHMKALGRVLQAHRDAGLKLQPDKCQVFQESIEYLGHIVSKEGIAPMADYVQIVKDWPIPRNRHEVRIFLGKTGYYRQFIKDYSAISRPLTDLLKTEDGRDDMEHFPITPEIRRSHGLLKTSLISAPILAYPQFDSENPLILDTDWSQENNAIGAVLSQVQEGKERVIAYGASKLTKSQANYGSTKGELAAAIIFMRRWKYYLQFTKVPFTLRIDNRALKWIYEMETPIGMIQRWLDTLANFNFKVQHRAGTAHGNADSLSRAPHLSEDPRCDLDVAQGEQIGALFQLGKLISSLSEQTSWTPEWVRQGQEEDEELGTIRRWVAAGTPPTDLQIAELSRIGKIYANLFASLTLDEHGVLRYEVTFGKDVGLPETKRVVVIPGTMQQDAIEQAHEAVAHMGPRLTVGRLERHAWFPHMLKWVEDYTRRCEVCQSKKGKVPDQKHTLVSHVSGYPFQKLSLDFVGPLPKSSKGNVYLLTVCDTFTRWLEAFPCKRATAQVVVDKLTQEIFPRYGVCDQIHSDRGSQFLSNLVKEVTDEMGIKQTTTPAYNPKSNPVERQHRSLGSAIISLSKQKQNAWEDVLPHALFAMRTSKCRTTGVAPFQALFGRDASTSLDLVFGNPPLHPGAYEDLYDYTRALKNRIGAAHTWARKNMASTLERQRKAYFKDKKAFEVGQFVWLWTPRLQPGQSKKFAIYWTGPWGIEAKLNEVMYRIKPSHLWARKKVETVSVDRLKPFLAQYVDDPNVHQPPTEDDDLRMAGDEFAESLLIDDEQDDDDDPNAPFVPRPGNEALIAPGNVTPPPLPADVEGVAEAAGGALVEPPVAPRGRGRPPGRPRGGARGPGRPRGGGQRAVSPPPAPAPNLPLVRPPIRDAVPPRGLTVAGREQWNIEHTRELARQREFDTQHDRRLRAQAREAREAAALIVAPAPPAQLPPAIVQEPVAPPASPPNAGVDAQANESIETDDSQYESAQEEQSENETEDTEQIVQEAQITYDSDSDSSATTIVSGDSDTDVDIEGLGAELQNLRTEG